jgi:ABC-type uncharacterized transport system substrate-binding protein
MLQQLKPGLRRLGVLFNPANATHKRLFADWQDVVAAQKIEVVPMPAVGPADLDKVILNAKAANAEIAIGLLGADTYAMRKEIAHAAKAHGFPIAMDTPGGFNQMGGVATIGVDIVPLYRRGAIELMIPMLKGMPPSALPWIGPREAVMKVNDGMIEKFGLAKSAK